MQIDGAIISSTTSSPRQSYGSLLRMPNSNNNEEKVEESSVVGGDLLLRDEGDSSSLGELTNNNAALAVMMTSSSSRVSSLLNRLVTIRSLSDVLPAHYTMIHLLLFNPHKVFPILLLLYLLLLVLWTPCYIAAYTLHITPLGVIGLLLISVFNIGRYILRLLVFPGTNVGVYREMENEFSNYCCTMLDSVAETIDNLIQSIDHDQEYSSTSSSTEEQVQATYYMHAINYSTKILGVYNDVLHCLLNGGGNKNDDQQQKNDFYERLCGHHGSTTVTSNCALGCKRSFCCSDRISDRTSQLNAIAPPPLSSSSSPPPLSSIMT